MNTLMEKLYSEEEYDRDNLPYRMYMKAVEEVFSLTTISSFADLGCNNGQLLSSIKAKYPKLKLWGCDYFLWSKKYADKTVVDCIDIYDLSTPILFKDTFDIVNCTEVGEHISVEFEDTLIDNILKVTNDILILSWSNEIQEQHLNPRPKSYIVEKLASKGFVFWECVTHTLESKLRKLQIYGAKYWWADNVMVFKKAKYLNINQSYFMQGIYTDNSSHKTEFLNNKGFALQKSYISLIETIRQMVALKTGFSIIRASDGDFYFLEAIPIGSAKPGKRALTRQYDYPFILYFKSLLWHNDIIAVETNQSVINMWLDYLFLQPLFYFFKKINISLQNKIRYFCWRSIRKLRLLFIATNTKQILLPLMKNKYGANCEINLKALFRRNFVPSECIYALVASKWIFKEFPDSIALIGSGEKLDLIKKLVKFKEYKNYLGVNKFIDYIKIPQIGASDNVKELSLEIAGHISKSKAKIFLVGAGSAKIGLLPLLKAQSDAVFLDIGCGMDAIAGIVCQDRPFFADWVNYKIKDYPYDLIDFMDEGNPKWNKKTYKTVMIK
jgi:2-polyprenyl-3-methyl-5-hydroxy-6-metoxy-1,4-benzoquinol methylase